MTALTARFQRPLALADVSTSAGPRPPRGGDLGPVVASDERGADVQAEDQSAVVATPGVRPTDRSPVLREPPPQGRARARRQRVRPDPCHPWRRSILAHLAGLEEEVDAVARPAGPGRDLRETSWTTQRGAKHLDGCVHLVHRGPPSATHRILRNRTQPTV